MRFQTSKAFASTYNRWLLHQLLYVMLIACMLVYSANSRGNNMGVHLDIILYHIAVTVLMWHLTNLDREVTISSHIA